MSDQLLTLADIGGLVRLSKSRLYVMRRDPRWQFPKPYRVLSSNRWSAQEVAEWIEWLKEQGRERVA